MTATRKPMNGSRGVRYRPPSSPPRSAATAAACLLFLCSFLLWDVPLCSSSQSSSSSASDLFWFLFSLSLSRSSYDFLFFVPFLFYFFIFFLKAETLGVKTPRLDRAPVPGATQHFFFRFCLYSISFRFGFFSSSSPSSTWRITPTDHEAKFMEHNTKQKQTKTNQTPSPVARHRMKCFITFFLKFLVCVFFLMRDATPNDACATTK